MGGILQALHMISNNVFKELPRIINEMHKTYLMKLEELKGQLVKTEQESKDLLDATELLEKTALRQATKLKQHKTQKALHRIASGGSIHRIEIVVGF
jgi:hypothetical protein